jgi:hypothetical protein
MMFLVALIAFGIGFTLGMLLGLDAENEPDDVDALVQRDLRLLKGRRSW